MGVTITGSSPEPKPEQDSKPEKVVEKAKPVSESSKVLAQIQKEKGAGLVIKGSQVPEVARIKTGVFEFDLATRGGFPKGRLSIIYGPESSGKTNMCYNVARETQRLPEPCNKVVWIDLEGTFDPLWAGQFGVNTDEVLLVKPGYGEEAADIIDALVQADDVALIVVDSIAVLTSAREVEASTEKANVGTEALLVKRICNKLATALSREARRGHFPAVIFVNQTRFKIGVMFGDPETMPGGNTMKFMSSLTIRVYGKNKVVKEINPNVPVFKETNAVVKKAKVPVNAISFQYDLCMLANEKLLVGQTNSFPIVDGHLRSLGLIKKVPKGWACFDEEYPTLNAIQDRYLNDAEFSDRLQSTVIKSLSGKPLIVEADPAVK